MKSIPTLKAAMTPFPYSVKIDTSLTSAEKMMREHNIHHLPVINKGMIFGVITQKDIDAIQTLMLNKKTDKKLEIRHAYISKPYIVDINEPLENVLLTMANKHIGAVIITKHKKLVGVFTFIDACRYFGEYIEAKFPKNTGDDAA